jgi:hypothetical protein
MPVGLSAVYLTRKCLALKNQMNGECQELRRDGVQGLGQACQVNSKAIMSLREGLILHFWD